MPHSNGYLHEGVVFLSEGGGPISWSPCWDGEADEVTQMSYAIWVNDRPNVGHRGASMLMCHKVPWMA